MNEPVLCYVDGPWAFFTTQSLDQQWGDDWDDAPYESNAGRPCDDLVARRDGTAPRWRIVKVAWDGDWDEPRHGHLNSPWSVEAINRGNSPWLTYAAWMTGPERDASLDVWAGTPLREFVSQIRRGGGTVYFGDETDLLALGQSQARTLRPGRT